MNSFFLAAEAEEELAETLAFYSEHASLAIAAAFLSEFTRVAHQRRRPGYWRKRK